MNLSRIIIPAAWLLSIVAALIIGGKMKDSTENTSSDHSHKQATDQSNHPPRINNRPSSARKPTPRSKSSRSFRSSRSGRQWNITDISQNDDPIARNSDLLELIKSLAPNEFQKVITDFRALGITQERMSEYSMLLHAWAKVDPLSALDYAEANTGTEFARQTILTSWASDDPDSAILWAKDHHEGDDANPWLVGVIRGLVSKNPTRATEVLLELPFSRERGDALTSIVPHIAKQGQEKALLWLDTITDDRLRTGATAYLAASLAKKDPAATADWITALPESEGKSRAAGEVAQQWANQDLQSALTWTDTLDGASKMKAAREVVGPYAKTNPVDASDWIQTMSHEPGYENVVRSYIWSTAGDNPELSLSHVPNIQSERSQQRYYERILRNWRDSDATAAEAWMDRHDVSENLRQRILK